MLARGRISPQSGVIRASKGAFAPVAGRYADSYADPRAPMRPGRGRPRRLAAGREFGVPSAAGQMPADPRIVLAPAVADPARNDAARRGRLRAKRLRASRCPLRRMPADGRPARSHVPFRVAGGGCRRPAAGPRVRASGMRNVPSGSMRPGPPDGGAAAAPGPAPHASPAPLFRHRHAVMPQERVRAPAAAAAPVWQSAFVRDPACRIPGSRIAAQRAASAVLLPAHLRQPQARPHLLFVARGQRSLFIRRAASGLRPPGDARPGGTMRLRAGSRRFRRSAPGRGVCSGRLWRSRARCRAAERVARKDTGGARRARPRVRAGTAPGRREPPRDPVPILQQG